MQVSIFDDFKIHQGLELLVRFDNYLLSNDLSERSITHKLAEHYQVLFNEWNVDCEYNRNLGGPKKIIIEPKEILRQMAYILKGTYRHILSRYEESAETQELILDLEKQLLDPTIEYIKELDIVLFVLKRANKKSLRLNIYPDIIIHHRGTMDNHIVIEAKKTLKGDKQARIYDLVKLMTLTSSPDFNYRRGYFIDIPSESDLKRFNSFKSSAKYMPKVFEIIPNLTP